MMMRVENTNCHSSDSSIRKNAQLPDWTSRGARGACFPLLKALLLLQGSSFLLKVSSLLLKALLLFHSFAATTLRFAPAAFD